MGKAARNERRKLTAAMLNAAGIAVLATGALAPVLQSALE